MRPFAASDLSDWGWRAAFIVGLVVSPAIVGAVTAAPVEQTVSENLPPQTRP